MDNRGLFLNAFRRTDFPESSYMAGISIDQVNLSETFFRGTIRGLHYQKSPFGEFKIIRALRGRVFDVVVDLRSDSPTFANYVSFNLSPQLSNAVAIPPGCAHGFQALEDNSQILYLHSGHWVQSAEAGIRYNDPSISIKWPLLPSLISERDCNLPFLSNV